MSIISSPFTKKPNSITQVMLWVILASLPGLAGLVYYFGYGVIINILLACATALLAEALVLKLRKKNIANRLGDCSALVTAWLIGLSLPPLLPWWMTVVGTLFAIVIAKQIYGGLGNNLFNPAMVAYVLLLISFPAQMTAWLPPTELATNSITFTDTISYIFTGSSLNGEAISSARLGIDGVTMATPLDHVKTELSRGYRIEEISNSNIMGNWAGQGWEMINLLFLIGGIILVIRKIAAWQIPAGMLLSMLISSFILVGINPDTYPSSFFHLFSGATMLGAFFIATDPVTASTTPRGRWVFGIGIGFLVIIIRTFGGYPDAVAFAVLLMNMAVPMIDYYTQPKVYGHQKSKREKS